MRRLAVLLLTIALPAAASTNNDDTCDLAVAPAATLLLPYFEVDVHQPATTAKTTLFTVTNVTSMPQIARVTLWTDWAYPILTFNLLLAAYQVQPVSLYEVLVRGRIGTDTPIEFPSTANPNLPAANCADNPATVPEPLRSEIVEVLTNGKAPSICNGASVGAVHGYAIGYATIDVVATCGSASPEAPGYFDELLFDNVLVGDYQIVNPNPATGNYAGGNPLVHIRAVPEGGPAGRAVPTNLPYTFYDRFTGSLPQRTFDRRQPLPSTFAARVIAGGAGAFRTDLRLWREGVATGCAGARANSSMDFAEIILFDEHENAFIPVYDGCGIIPECVVPQFPALMVGSIPGWSIIPTYPFLNTGSGGWIYFNLDNGGAAAYSAARPGFSSPTSIGPRASQNWVTMSMYAEGRYAVEMDAFPLGNGCSPAVAPFVATIAPAANQTP